MIGGHAGDMIASVFERHRTTNTDFPLCSHHSRFTDDTVLTVAKACAILNGCRTVAMSCGSSSIRKRAGSRRAAARPSCFHRRATTHRQAGGFASQWPRWPKDTHRSGAPCRLPGPGCGFRRSGKRPDWHAQHAQHAQHAAVLPATVVAQVVARTRTLLE